MVGGSYVLLYILVYAHANFTYALLHTVDVVLCLHIVVCISCAVKSTRKECKGNNGRLLGFLYCTQYKQI